MPTRSWSDRNCGGRQEGRAGSSNPLKKTEYEIRFATNDARKGWRDLVATIRNPITETWDYLTRTPLTTTPTNYQLKGDPATVQRVGKSYDRWQQKPTGQVRRRRARRVSGFMWKDTRCSSSKYTRATQMRQSSTPDARKGYKFFPPACSDVKSYCRHAPPRLVWCIQTRGVVESG